MQFQFTEYHQRLFDGLRERQRLQLGRLPLDLPLARFRVEMRRGLQVDPHLRRRWSAATQNARLRMTLVSG